MMASPNVQCRPATHADYEDVMDINRNVYRGRDHLAAMYHKFIETPLMYSYVAEYEQKIVSIFIL